MNTHTHQNPLNKTRFAVLTGMVLTVTAFRFIPHAPNFTPVTALALFGGASFSSKRAAILMPVLGLCLSDLVLGFYRITPVVYGSLAMIAGLGCGLRRKSTPGRIGLAAVASAVVFYLFTNFGVWVLDNFYPKTGAGLVECYVAAIPFFRNTLASSVLYAVLLFGGLNLAERRFASLRRTVDAA